MRDIAIPRHTHSYVNQSLSPCLILEHGETLALDVSA